MRKILFRGKDKKGIWQYGDFNFKRSSPNMPKICGISNDNGIKGFWFEIIPETVGQLVFNLNGHLFFEGDIIRNLSKCRYVIMWNDVNQCFSTFSVYGLQFINGDDDLLRLNILSSKEALRISFLDKHNFYPIGNIHDNPELLK